MTTEENRLLIRHKIADFINNLRIEHARGLLSRGGRITDVAYASGFSSIRTFNRVFSEEYGCSPSEYRKKKTT